MKVLLKKDVPNLGRRFQVIEVADGYARNYLIPKGLAEVATPATIKVAETHLRRQLEKDARQEQEAQRLAERLKEAVVEIKVPAGETGRLYHSISAQEIARTISQSLKITLERDHILLEEPIRTLGIHTVPVRLHRNVRTTVRVNVVPASH
ncbi:MAG: 50S ribosomal protein L9 [Armatimonadetes bacterium]|nr:50S ribosomal protein L9 [Armatimonadota bacterium]